MAQFDVHRNPGGSRDTVPFVVIVQSRQFDGVPTRLAAPLIELPPGSPLRAPAHLPRVSVLGRSLVLDMLQLQSIPRGALGPAVASLADDDSATRIVSALDAITSRAYG
jgi:toxin CcdB